MGARCADAELKPGRCRDWGSRAVEDMTFWRASDNSLPLIAIGKSEEKGCNVRRGFV